MFRIRIKKESTGFDRVVRRWEPLTKFDQREGCPKWKPFFAVDVLNAMKTKFAVRGYLLKIIQNYLRDREFTCGTNEGRKRKQIASGPAQKSILGPDLWNITYDIFRIEMPDGTHLTGYADDVAARIVIQN